MADWMMRGRLWQLLLVVFVGFVMVSSLTDIVEEFSAGETWMQMLDDVLQFVISAMLMSAFVVGFLRQHRDLADLRQQLFQTQGQLAAVSEHSQRVTAEFRELIQQQFEQWSLTNSECEVALALLKGLSFREVALLRDTREKTVRQQAVQVYRKSGVAGRHELAAWFFEDLLAPGADPSEAVAVTRADAVAADPATGNV